MGLSAQKTAELLMEQRTNSPWIHFESPPATRTGLKDDWYTPGCSHKKLDHQSLTISSTEEDFASTSRKGEIKRLVEGFCGLGGVGPLSGERDRLVRFSPARRLARITYCEGPSHFSTNGGLTLQQTLIASHLMPLARALDNLYCAASSLQSNQLCCESFTILVRPLESGPAELIRVSLSHISDLHSSLLGGSDFHSSLPGLSDPFRMRNTAARTTCQNCDSAFCRCDGQLPCMRCFLLQDKCEYEDTRHGELIKDRGNGRSFEGHRSQQDRLTSQGATVHNWLWPSLRNRISQSVEIVNYVAHGVLAKLMLYLPPPPLPTTRPGSVDLDISSACLATQVLATGLLSYMQAHVSPLRPFFLDANIDQVSLLGAQPFRNPPQIILRPFRLTCMHEMLQRHVLVFQAQKFDFNTMPELPSVFETPELPTTPELHMFATPEDILDTWGPGCYLTSPSKIHGGLTKDIWGVRVSGGTIMESAEQSYLYHFYPATNIRPAGNSRTIRQNENILIGASINISCDSTRRMYLGQKDHILNKLGTHSGGWELIQRQAGFQGGQYANITFTQTWNKLPDSTIKKFQLSKRSPFDLVFLEAPWGLQVSYCTGIAKRVRMRELLADVIPAHLSIQLKIPKAWKDLEQDKVIEVLRGTTNLQEWYNERSTEQQTFLEETMRDVLELLKFTGVDSSGKLLSVAWILPKQDFRCLRIPCEHESAWAKILADAEDCATFAYFTPRCLVTESITCGTLQSGWQNKSYALSTAISPCPESTARGAFLGRTGPYYIENPINRFKVCVDNTSQDMFRLLVSESRIGEKYWRRLASRNEFICKIHERQDIYSPSRPVLLSATQLPNKGA